MSDLDVMSVFRTSGKGDWPVDTDPSLAVWGTGSEVVRRQDQAFHQYLAYPKPQGLANAVIQGGLAWRPHPLEAQVGIDVSEPYGGVEIGTEEPFAAHVWQGDQLEALTTGSTKAEVLEHLFTGHATHLATLNVINLIKERYTRVEGSSLQREAAIDKIAEADPAQIIRALDKLTDDTTADRFANLMFYQIDDGGCEPMDLDSMRHAAQFIAAHRHLPKPSIVLADEGRLSFEWLPGDDRMVVLIFRPDGEVDFVIDGPTAEQPNNVVPQDGRSDVASVLEAIEMCLGHSSSR